MALPVSVFNQAAAGVCLCSERLQRSSLPLSKTTMQPHSHKLLEKVEQTILSQNMLKKGDRILTAVSGGPDSVALLHLLLRLAPKWELKIGVAHLNHCLRGAESDRDAEFVADLAAKLNLPCYSDAIDVRGDPAFLKLSLEATARNIRYDFFDRICRRSGYGKIALGHQRNDNAELMLMFLFRGSGLMGFSGIPPAREGRIVRPLIETDRNELVAFLNENAISYQIDKSNRDMRFLRNRIRNEMIPYIQACYNPGIVGTLNRFSKIVRSENEWMDEIIQPIFENALVSTDKQRLVLSISAFSEFPQAVRRRVIRSAIARIKGDLLRISFSHVEAARYIAERRQGPAHLMMPDGIRIQRDKNLLIFYQIAEPAQNRRQKFEPAQQPFFYWVTGTGECVTIYETGAVLTFSEMSTEFSVMNLCCNKIALLDMDTLNFPLTVRNIQPGDRFNPLGMTGTQKIAKYLVDHKIERSERLQCPVILSGEQIIWLAGYRINGRFKVTPSTRKVLRIEMFRPTQQALE
jgi:tRNA(Ile)-lysidine synthase